MNVDAQLVIARYQAELAVMTQRALAAEAAVEQLQATHPTDRDEPVEETSR